MFSKNNSGNLRDDKTILQLIGKWKTEGTETMSSVEIDKQGNLLLFNIDGQKYLTKLEGSEEDNLFFQTEKEGEQFNRIVVSLLSDKEIILSIQARDSQNSTGVSRPLNYYKTNQ
ncbi:hypothetical protein [Enterococcus sp. HY326]|uniref:hypothetical protein n=1 Tax=Enterococcus sp. HY326 TaxID=2971265 RepID=UPI00223FC95A|nr:hypothetical protein [Enterococcus sp. HY326]